MNESGIEALDATVQKTNVWLNDIMNELGTDDRHLAYGALRACLHALRDRLPVDVAAHLAAQLPMLVCGLYYDGWRPAGKPMKTHREEFLASIESHFRSKTGRPEASELAQAVFRVLSAHVTAGEIEDVKRVLPEDLRRLWAD